MKLPKQFVFVFVAAIVCCAGAAVYAEYGIADSGVWPDSWPDELEPLRKQSRTVSGPEFGPTIYEVPFADRNEFEAAWPHILKVRSEGGSVILLRGPDTKRFIGTVNAGVRVLSPSWVPPDQASRYAEEASRSGVTIRTVTDIELVVDGEIVDLNRIPLPADTPIIDRRFPDADDE